ncbi:hypothetical protein CSB45_07875 [candidate division KSB3 bacterium]|uniref:Uncharacterized protein n=1 Tax=candidate division KSB3 bacterium TaxID=2044937 RepID=A0A2G6E6L7_9BACT|nr:MAG: hypothetical protein CSB45_07875 [candidate division KSB3 bacterium]PIE29947.1 MAG: hypothetical protein CSA57_06575 [candidate division KSB3 bacterium]
MREYLKVRCRFSAFVACLLLLAAQPVPGFSAEKSSEGVTLPEQIPALPAWVQALPGKIVFQSDRDGDWEIYAMNVDGSHLIQLTDNPAQDRYPVWSPDGQRIVFESNRGGSFDIYVMQADGSGQQRLTDHPANETNPAWSPDGLQIAFDSDRASNREIYVMPADGSTVQALTTGFGKNILPAWSPDGKRMAYTGNRYVGWNVYVMDLHSGKDERVTGRRGAYGACRPDWSPDGSRIAYVSQEADKHGDIWSMNPDGSDSRQLVFDTEHADYYPAWSPDGQYLLYAKSDHKDRGNWELYLMTADGKQHVRLTYHSAQDTFPDWGRGQITEEQFFQQRFHYEAENLPRTTGRVLDDPDASQRKSAFSTQSDGAGFLAYGPYQLFSPGEYTAHFRLKIDDSETHKTLVRLDVAADTGKMLLAERELHGPDFNKEAQYQDFQLPFSLSKELQLEFRVFSMANAALRLDSISVTRRLAD